MYMYRYVLTRAAHADNDVLTGAAHFDNDALTRAAHADTDALEQSAVLTVLAAFYSDATVFVTALVLELVL